MNTVATYEFIIYVKHLDIKDTFKMKSYFFLLMKGYLFKLYNTWFFSKLKKKSMLNRNGKYLCYVSDVIISKKKIILEKFDNILGL